MGMGVSVGEQVSGPPVISKEVESEIFPCDEKVVFHESSFFKQHGAPASLPSPTEVREIASQSGDVRSRRITRPPPVIFRSLGLLVKYGTEVTLAEGQCLLLVRKLLSPDVPVPEVYGWCKDSKQTFIYMQLVEGVTLEKSWETMVEKERVSVCSQLRHMVEAWRCLKQDTSYPFIGKVVSHVVFASSTIPYSFLNPIL